MFKSKQENGRRQKNGILRVLLGVECARNLRFYESFQMMKKPAKNLRSWSRFVVEERVMKSCSLWTCFSAPTRD